MASTYSDYKFELIGTGEQAGTWGATTNTNLGTAIEQAIGGKADITMSSTSQTLTLTDTNAAQDARALYLNLSGTPGGAATLNVPAIEKAYIVKNGTNQTVTVKVTGQTGVAIPTGKTMHLYNNGTDVVNALDNLPAGTTLNGVALSTTTGTVTSVSGTGTVNGLTLTGTVTSSGNLTLGGSLSAVNLASQVTGTLPSANGGTAQSTYTTGDLLYASGTNTLAKRGIGSTGQVLTVTGGVPTWATPASGGVTSVTASSPLASSGGSTPNISFTGTLPVANGGTGQASYTNGQLLIGNTSGNTLTKATLTAGTGISVTNGGGSITIASTVTGDVVGPASSTDNGIALFDSTTGKLLKDSASQDGFVYGVRIGRGNSAQTGNNVVGSGGALGSVTTGQFNTAFGNEALDNCTTGERNVGIGSGALTDITTGSWNVALGVAPGFDISNTASYNTFLGVATGGTSTQDRNICVGYFARSGGSDRIVIGHDITGQGDNYFTFGKSGNVVYNQFTVNNSWTRSSDERLKRNIQDDTLGLSFITKLRPVTFQWKPSNEVPQELTDHYFEENKMDLEATMNGFIAQDVKQALDEVGAGDQGVWSVEKDGTQAISREMFIMPLVNAVKELKAEIDTLKAEIATLKGG